MRRVLFVDDESDVLAGIEKLFVGAAGGWDLAFATSGEEALDWLRENHVDVLVTDLRLPGMDGAELLRTVRVRHPHLVRFILTSEAELTAAKRALPIAHQFLTRPIAPTILLNALQRACQLGDLLDGSELQSFVGCLGELPARPRVYSQLCEMLADDLSGVPAIGRLIEQDMGLASKMLQVANSALFARGNPVRSTPLAVGRLGLDLVKSLVLGAEVFNHFGGERTSNAFLDGLHARSVRVAHLVKLFSDGQSWVDDALLAAVMHDVGRLILAQHLGTGYRDLIVRADVEGLPLRDVERDAVGVSHAELGAYLLGLWGMPYPAVEAVAHHHDPHRVASTAFDAVTCVASCVFLAERHAGEAVDAAPLRQSLERLGIGSALETWSNHAANIWEARV